ncbi:hypothetical protein JCM8097_000075 [Rhodosporidiobolus ruineniae]
MADQLPPAFHAWYGSNYPTLVFNPDWISGCVDYLLANDSQAQSSTQGLIKAVEVQLLSSDLSTSVIPPPANRAAFTTRLVAKERAMLFPGGKKGRVLVQVQSVEDIAHSAGSTLEVLKEKREAAKLRARGGGGDGGGRIMSLDDGDEQEEEDEMKRAILGGAGKEPTFPRGNGKLLLSDGANEVRAFEVKRIMGLGLEEIKLGTKLLIHDVPFVNGILMLNPENTIVKGYQVEELEAVAEWQLENSLRERLQMDPLPLPDGQAPPPPPPDDAANPAHDDSDIDIDMKPAVAAPARRAPPPAAGPSQPKPPKPSFSSSLSKPRPKAAQQPQVDDSFDFDDEFPFDELLAQEQAARGRNQHAAEDGFDEEDEEAMRAMMEYEQVGPPPVAKGKGKKSAAAPPPPPAPKPTQRRVKPEPPSSGSAGRSATLGASSSGGRSVGSGGGRSRTGLSGAVEVLELDSDDEDDALRQEIVRPPVRKKAKSEGVTIGVRKKKTEVLELDDSD